MDVYLNAKVVKQPTHTTRIGLASRAPRAPHCPPPLDYYYITVEYVSREGGSTSRHEGVRAENVTLHLVSWSRSSVQDARPRACRNSFLLCSKSSISYLRKYGIRFIAQFWSNFTNRGRTALFDLTVSKLSLHTSTAHACDRLTRLVSSARPRVTPPTAGHTPHTRLSELSSQLSSEPRTSRR